jgi:hypothetical protein
MFDFDGTGIDSEQKNFEKKILPKGWYDWEILDFVSKSGDQYPKEGFTKENKYPKVDILLSCVSAGPFQGERIFHTVTFLPKEKAGAGMAIHFLKTINQLWEGKFSVNALDWIGERFQGYTVTDEYKGNIKNKITQVKKTGEVPADLPF